MSFSHSCSSKFNQAINIWARYYVHQSRIRATFTDMVRKAALTPRPQFPPIFSQQSAMGDTTLCLVLPSSPSCIPHIPQKRVVLHPLVLSFLPVGRVWLIRASSTTTDYSEPTAIAYFDGVTLNRGILCPPSPIGMPACLLSLPLSFSCPRCMFVSNGSTV